jgi:hypothetical protein
MSFFATSGSQGNAGFEEQRRQKQEMTDLFKTLEGAQALIKLKLEIWCRNGASEELRKQINEAAEVYGEAFDKIMASSPIRLPGPKQ